MMENFGQVCEFKNGINVVRKSFQNLWGLLYCRYCIFYMSLRKKIAVLAEDTGPAITTLSVSMAALFAGKIVN